MLTKKYWLIGTPILLALIASLWATNLALKPFRRKN